MEIQVKGECVKNFKLKVFESDNLEKGVSTYN